jgi:hydroxyethylthiazole kinase-like uncharacterized protein yjeF
MRAWEQASWAAGQTEREVIRRVGATVAGTALRLTRTGDLVLILAGKGNNGEDARSALPHLVGRRVEAFDVTDPQNDLARLDALLSLQPALIIDALFGIGLDRPLSSEWVRFFQRINSSHSQVLAVDLPSGLNADTGETEGEAVEATVTLTVGSPKRGLLVEAASRFVGRLEVAADVGLAPCPSPSELLWTVPQDFRGFPPPRPVATHKGTYGHLAILAGSLGLHGAAVLAARGAQRAQPGLITLYTQEAVYAVVASQLQAVMVHPLRASTARSGSFDAVLMGPGLAAPDDPDELKGRLRDVWLNAPIPVVVDASALDWLPASDTLPEAPRVITPHPGEAARLLGLTSEQVQSNRMGAVRDLSKKFGHAWVVLKGHQTLVGKSSGEVYVNSSGNPHLAQGGSGDVLAGYLAGLLAQERLREHPLTAIRFAVWQHGAAADMLQGSRRNWIVEDLVEALGNAPF